eukprot:10057711-Karenia_brevis.AAC.1
MSQAAISLYCIGKEMLLQTLPAEWWRVHQRVETFVEGNMYTQGYASGDGFNCLIDTLRQKHSHGNTSSPSPNRVGEEIY